jgi:hypothetical protein
MGSVSDQELVNHNILCSPVRTFQLESTWKTGGIQAELSRKVQNTGVKEQELENAISVSQFHLENFELRLEETKLSVTSGGNLKLRNLRLIFSTCNS